jgi:hypothetical protein
MQGLNRRQPCQLRQVYAISVREFLARVRQASVVSAPGYERPRMINGVHRGQNTTLVDFVAGRPAGDDKVDCLLRFRIKKLQ